jgi:uncharacterized protein (TIGR03437 family)
MGEELLRGLVRIGLSLQTTGSTLTCRAMAYLSRFLVVPLLAAALTAQRAPRAITPLRAGDSTVSRRIPDTVANAPIPAAFSEEPLSPLESRVHHRGPLRQAGVRRAVPQSAVANIAVSISPEARTILTTALRSPGAHRVRLHFRDFHAGLGEVWILGKGAQTAVGPYTGSGIFGDGEFWAAGVDGDTATIAYVAPPGTTPATLPFHVDALSHQWITSSLSGSDSPASCNLDVACYPDYRSAATAVVEYELIADDGSGEYTCSGTMINTRSSSLTPYLLTAHHCIGSDTEARSIQAFFLYQTAACDGAAPSLSTVPTVLGGHYVAGGNINEGDFSLVLLSGVPGGVTLMGWNTTADPAAPVEGIHHPRASYTRISFGNRAADADVAVGAESAPAARYYNVDWTAGLTEAGSSGSPLLNTDGEIIGILTGAAAAGPGQDICTARPASLYGRFSSAYATIASYLEDGARSALTQSRVSVAVTPGPVYQQLPDAGGYQWSFTVHLAETAGIGATITDLKIDSTDYREVLPSVFGTTRVAGMSALSSSVLRMKDLAVPRTGTLEITGVDDSGHSWQATTQIQFRGPQVSTPKPAILSGGIGNAASYTQQVAPGSLLAIFGNHLALTTATAASVPLPLQLGGASITINGIAAPLFMASPDQLTAQMPFEVTPGSAQVVVSVEGQSDTQQVQVAAVAPGVFTSDGMRLGTPGLAHRGDVLSLFLTGQGPLSPTMQTGQWPTEAPVAELPQIVQPVEITVGSVPAKILFAGVPAGLVGIAQINFVVPQDSAIGDQPVVVSVGDQQAKAVILTINP